MSGNQAYTVNCMHADLTELADRHEQLTRRFFAKVMDNVSTIYYLPSVTQK